MKRQSSTMKVPPALVVGLAAIIPMVSAQTACSSDASIMGFSTIAALNAAMQAELAEIENGKTPEESYKFILCPETSFDTSFGPLRPLLSEASFECGSNGRSENSCTMEGGSQQILIEDSSLPSYLIETLFFSGITFADFTQNAFESGTSVYAAASSTTTATFQDCIWLDFDANSIVRQVHSDPSTPPMAVAIGDSSIGAGIVSNSVFFNDGGVLSISNMVVRELTANEFITTVNRGSSNFLDSSISESIIDRVTQTTSRSDQRAQSVSITRMAGLSTAFVAQESGTSLFLQDVSIEDNILTSPWQAVDVQGGAVGQIDRSSLSTNSGLQFGIVARGAQSVISVQRTSLSNNFGLGPNITGAPLFAIRNAVMSVDRTNINGNTEYSGQALSFFGSSLSFTKSCFEDVVSSFVVFIDKESTQSVSENFLRNSASTFCGAPGNRLFLESQDSGCFTGGICQGTCAVLADQDECRSSDPLPTSAPTLVPTASPTISSKPSASPTTASPTISANPTLSPTRKELPSQKPTVCNDGKGKGMSTGTSRSHKMKLGSMKNLRPSMKMKPLPKNQYLEEWLEAKYVQASEGTVQVQSSEKTIQFSDENSDYSIGTTCAPTVNKSTKSGQSSSTKSTKSMNMMNMKNMMGKGKGKGSSKAI